MAFEELPRKLQQKIANRKKKREELKLQRKLKVDFNQPEEQILVKYKLAYPDTPEEQLAQQIKYQKLIH